jgi:hypothetical protein
MGNKCDCNESAKSIDLPPYKATPSYLKKDIINSNAKEVLNSDLPDTIDL